MAKEFDDIFEDAPEKCDACITFWFKSSTKEKYRAFDNHKNKRQIIARIKKAAEAEIERLFEKLSDAG